MPALPSARGTLPQNRINTVIPEPLLAALERMRGEYAYGLKHVFHCFQLHTDDVWIGVAGDGENGSYEWFVWKDGKLQTSDCGFGSTDWALKEVVNKEVR